MSLVPLPPVSQSFPAPYWPVFTLTPLARLQVFKVVKIQVKVFWAAMPCSAVVGYQHFRGLCCFHLQGEVNGTGKGVTD